MKYQYVIAILIGLIVSGCCTISPVPESLFSPWLGSDQYQAYFEERKSVSYPVIAEGALIDGKASYRAAYVAFPAKNFLYWSHHGLTVEQFANRDRELRANGFILITTQSFTDQYGIVRVQGTWTKQQ